MVSTTFTSAPAAINKFAPKVWPLATAYRKGTPVNYIVKAIVFFLSSMENLQEYKSNLFVHDYGN